MHSSQYTVDNMKTLYSVSNKLKLRIKLFSRYCKYEHAYDDVVVLLTILLSCLYVCLSQLQQVTIASYCMWYLKWSLSDYNKFMSASTEF